MHHLHLEALFDILDVVALHAHHSGCSLILPRGLRHVSSPCCPCSPFPVPHTSFVWCQWWPFVILVIMALSVFPICHGHRSSLRECSLIVKKKNC